MAYWPNLTEEETLSPPPAAVQGDGEGGGVGEQRVWHIRTAGFFAAQHGQDRGHDS